MTEVVLTWFECGIAAYVASQRCIQNIAKGRKHTYGEDDDGRWDRHVHGAASELALAKLTNRFWSGAVGDIRAPDVDGMELRMSEREDASLILHKRDDPNRIFILATGAMPKFTFIGWMMAYQGQNDTYWKDKSGKNRWAYFVPQEDLFPMESLIQKSMGGL